MCKIFVFFGLLWLSLLALADPLTTAQLATLKTAIIADSTAGPMRSAGDAYSLLHWCNAPSTTVAWRTGVTGTEIYDAHKPVEYIARSAAERSAFDLMVEPNRAHNFTVLAKRNGVADIFSGATHSTSRTAIFAIAQEFATNAQLALGGSSASVGGNANMSETVTAFKRNWADTVSPEEVNKLVN